MVSILNELIVSVTVLPDESSTLIVQSEYVPSSKNDNVIELFPEIAVTVVDEHEPPYEMVPASSEENV